MSDPENDDFLRGYHGIPDDAKLRGLSDIELDSLLASCEKGTAKFLSVEREFLRRRAIQHAPPKPKKSFWEHPLMRTLLYIVSVVGAAAIIYFFGLKK